MQIEVGDTAGGKLSGVHDIPLDEMGFQPGKWGVTLLFWLEEKGHYNGSQRGKQLNPNKVMTRFSAGKEGAKAGTVVQDVKAWTRAA